MQKLSGVEKRKIILREWMDGRGYYQAMKAMEFGAQHHTGFRKDGVTPEFDHQNCIALYIRTLPRLLHPEATLAVAFLHDVREDKDVEHSVLVNMFGGTIADAVWRMTKVFKGIKRSEEEVFAGISQCPIASIAKGSDRIHNFQSMVGVFSFEKQKAYIEEGERLFLPMIRTAKELFPEQRPSYENIKLMLKSQMALIKEIHKSAGA